MKGQYFSLIWPKKENARSNAAKLPAAAIEDLKLNWFIGQITRDPNEIQLIMDIMTELCFDQDTIRYRQQIFRDLRDCCEFRTFLSKYMKRLDYLKFISKNTPVFEDIAIWKLISMLKELETYIGCVLELKEAMDQYQFTSNGLLKLKEQLNEITGEDHFTKLRKDIDQIKAEFNGIKSITVGLNLDSYLNPIEATILSLNTTTFKSTIKIPHIPSAGKLQQEVRDGRLHRKTHSLVTNRSRSIIARLMNQGDVSDVDSQKRDMEDFLRPVIKDLMSLLNQFINSRGYFLLGLIPEFQYYMNCINFFDKLGANLPLCFPEIEDIGNRLCILQEVYNPSLAWTRILENTLEKKPIVLNDLSFEDDGRILLLTGPNMGGKTVITEAVGLCQILFQAGLPIPAAFARISPCDSVFTHFPVREDLSEDLGRLGEECVRLSQILNAATEKSLVLMNESLASTSFMEGMYIAQDVLCYMRHRGMRALYNTHMHELGERAQTLNDKMEGSSNILSLVTGMEEGNRSYKIMKASPLMKSYALEIAEKHGIRLFQILSRMDQKSH